jgi:NAD(P)H-hydrate epimerase
MIAGLLAQGTGAEAAAYVGVFLHGLAGDIAAKEVGERSLLAHDILDCIPRALALVEKGGGAAI